MPTVNKTQNASQGWVSLHSFSSADEVICVELATGGGFMEVAIVTGTPTATDFHGHRCAQHELKNITLETGEAIFVRIMNRATDSIIVVTY